MESATRIPRGGGRQAGSENSAARFGGDSCAEFASADEKGLAVNQELLGAVLGAKMRQIGRLSPGDCKEDQTNQSRTGSAHHIRHGPPHGDASGFPLGGGA